MAQNRVLQSRTAAGSAAGAPIGVLADALDLLALFSPEWPEWRLTDLSRRIGMSKNKVFRILQTLASRGIVEQVNVGERDEGAAAISAPVRDGAGKVIAALSLGGLVDRILDRRGMFITLVQDAAQQISRRMGYATRPSAWSGSDQSG